MARPRTISDEQILSAARAVFLEVGIRGSTIEIARRAGVAEGSLFVRYPTKEALFLAAMRTPALPDWVLGLDRRVGQGSCRQHLVELVGELVVSAREDLPLVLALWSAQRDPSTQQTTLTSPTQRDRRLLARYLGQERERGRLRATDLDTLTELLFGAAYHYALESLIAQRAPTPAECAAFAEGVVASLWSGIAPPGR